MELSVCAHGVMAGTHCEACLHERRSTRPRVQQPEPTGHPRQNPAELAAQLGGVVDTCPHGTPLSEPCGTCRQGWQEGDHKREVATRMATLPPPGLSPAEAVYGLLGWLTSREQPVTFSVRHGATEAGNAAAEFCEANGLGDPRLGWERNLTHPTGPPTDHEAALVERPAGHDDESPPTDPSTSAASV